MDPIARHFLRLVAFLDASAPLPQVLCDVLLRLAERDLFRSAWASDVFDDLINNLRQVHPELGEEQLKRRRRAMVTAFPQALVTG